ncbi:MAG TPA: hypothetical protein VGT00_12170 [Methylomirabilota bacterium]|nr:hypothetical protein [Methylomirabilota bacterium]
MLFAPWLVVLLLGAAGIVEMSIGLHAARLKKPFLLPAHHLYWTRAAVFTLIMLMLPRLPLRSAPGVNSNALDAMLLLPVVLAAGCFWMLGRGYAAPGVAVESLLETVREVLGQMGYYSARESVPRAGEHELMIKDLGVVVTVSAPWWSGTPRLRVQPADESGLLRQVVTAVNVLLALGPYEVRSAPFMLHTLKGGVLIVAAVAGLIALVARGTLSPA